MPITLKKTQTVPSKVAPGVEFEVRTVTHGMRMQIELDVIESNGAAREYAHEATRHIKGKPVEDPEALKAMAKLQILDKQARLPILLRAALIGIRGIAGEDGGPISVDQFLALAPSDLIEEAYAACEAAAGLTSDERKNSESPSTSGSLADGETSGTTAESA